jgi:hypothetical protein
MGALCSGEGNAHRIAQTSTGERFNEKSSQYQTGCDESRIVAEQGLYSIGLLAEIVDRFKPTWVAEQMLYTTLRPLFTNVDSRYKCD